MREELNYWDALDQLVSETRIVVDRPAQSQHPRFSDIVYPFDYGYLEGTRGGDGDGIDVWLRGEPRFVSGVINTIDLFKRDAEVKLLLGFSLAEMQELVQFHNKHSQRAHLLVRP